MKGQPDLVIGNLHKRYNGFALEFKTPKGDGTLSHAQKSLLRSYRGNGYKTHVSSDYDECSTEIIEYMRDTRIQCDMCVGRFRNPNTLRNHKMYFHRMYDID